MFAVKRNQIIVTALAVMIGVAGYLNFTEDKIGEKNQTAIVLNDDGTSAEPVLADKDGAVATLPDDLPGDMDFAMGEDIVSPTVDAAADADDTGAAIFVNKSVDADTYFVQAKLDREQARSKQRDILTEMINNDKLEQKKKSQCADNMIEIQERIEKETAAEAMIEAKGFKEAYVRIDDETVDVVVAKSELTESELAQIMDIVKRKTGVAEDKIRICPLKK